MNSIEVQAQLDDGVKTLRISQPDGFGDSYQIIIDNYYHGRITRYESKWAAYLNDKSELTEKNIQTLGKLIENRFGIQE